MQLFEILDSEPLDLWLQARGDPPCAQDGIREIHFELTSRGDRVPGRLLLPASAPGPFPLLLLEHGAGGSKQAAYLDATAIPWVRGGAAVASIDLPLHGERTNGKLTQRFLDGLGFERQGEQDRLPAGLWKETLRQAVLDLRRTLDALATLPELDAERVAYAAFSLGSIFGACFCAVDPRPRAAALALGGGGFGPAEVDPARWIGRFAPRPLLFVSATRDERIPREAAEAFFRAAGEPKERVWVDCRHSELPGSALKVMWKFLSRNVGLRPADSAQEGDAARASSPRSPRPASPRG